MSDGQRKLWGFADLHAHPATHLGFGADHNGKEGIFWGKPGLRYADAARTLPSDLPPCDADKHDDFDIDIVRHLTRRELLAQLEELSGFSHTRGGWPGFDGWPHALSVLHQQMHISWMRRAYEGGLRLLVASVTDNQTLVMLWKNGFNVLPRLEPADPQFDYESARKQLAFIRRVAAGNSDWMQVVTSPGEARDAIGDDKLAVVLSLEMDILTLDQIRTLANDFGVRHITPVHLVDNEFGGVAVCEDIFNTNNFYCRREFLRVEGNSDIEFRLSKPSYPALEFPNVVRPRPVTEEEYRALGYACCPHHPVPGCVPEHEGHQNKRGLNPPLLLALMREGLLIDVAHMSEKSTGEALAVAERYHYPLMSSHTSLRPDCKPPPSDGLDGRPKKGSERDVSCAHAKRIGRLGGLIGLGTGNDCTGRLVFCAGGEAPMPAPLLRLTGDQSRWAVCTARPDVESGTRLDRLVVRVKSGSDGLRGGSSADLTVDLGPPGAPGAETVVLPLNHGEEWAAGETRTRALPLPRDVTSGQLRAVGLKAELRRDDWEIDEIEVELESGGLLWADIGRPLTQLSTDHDTWQVPLANAEQREIDRLHVTIQTGDDNLRRGSRAAAVLRLRDGTELRLDLNRGGEWDNGSVRTKTLSLPPGTTLADLGQLQIQADLTAGFGTDKWEIDAIRLDYGIQQGTLVRLSDQPLARLTGEQPGTLLYADAGLDGAERERHVRLTIKTGGDDLRERSRAWATLGLKDRAVRVALNRGACWRNGSTHKVIFALPVATRRDEIVSLQIATDFAGGVAGDNWSIDAVGLELVEDPVAGWAQEYEAALELIGGGAVAFGTDMNGYTPQISFSAQPLPYPIDPAHTVGGRDETGSPLGRCHVGNRHFDFTRDGLAHYGLFPDFIAALALDSNRRESLMKLYESADAFVQMWEAVEQAKRNLGDD